MYQSPAALDVSASYYQEEARHHADHRRLEHEADGHSATEHKLIAAAVAVLMVLSLALVF